PRLDLAEHRSAAVGGDDVQFAVAALPVALQDRQALLLQQLRGQPLPFAPQRVPVPQGVVVGQRTDDRIRHASSYLPDESVLTQRARRAGRAAEPNRKLWTTPLAVDNQQLQKSGGPGRRRRPGPPPSRSVTHRMARLLATGALVRPTPPRWRRGR